MMVTAGSLFWALMKTDHCLAVTSVYLLFWLWIFARWAFFNNSQTQSWIPWCHQRSFFYIEKTFLTFSCHTSKESLSRSLSCMKKIIFFLEF